MLNGKDPRINCIVLTPMPYSTLGINTSICPLDTDPEDAWNVPNVGVCDKPDPLPTPKC